VLHLPLRLETRDAMSAEHFAQLSRGRIIIETTRAIVNVEVALLDEPALDPVEHTDGGLSMARKPRAVSF
jgi:phosphoglycerate dehydrogenase-like enzyme